MGSTIRQHQYLRRGAPSLVLLVITLVSISLPHRSCAFVVPRHIRATATATASAMTKRDHLRLNMANSKYEGVMERLPSQAVIDAVQRSNQSVIASDVAALAGVSLRQARKELTTLASLSQGDIAVSTDGELIYSFPSNLNSALAANSAKFKALQIARKVWPAIFYGIRVSFGIALVASLLAIFSTIFFISQGSNSSEDDRRRENRGGGGGMSFGGSYWWGPSPFDFLYYRPYYGYYNTPERDPEEMGFLESVFSYIFGDGNPNYKLQERRLLLATNYIRARNGAVTAEELAPFCDDAPEPDFNGDDSAYVNEAFVLPIVTALDGEPRVTEEGDIVYVFPELQMSAASTSSPIQRLDATAIMLKKVGLEPDAGPKEIKALLERSGISTRGALEKKDLLAILEAAMPPMTAKDEELFGEEDPSMLLEQEFKFSLATDGNKVLAGGLGVVNLAGALYLGQFFQRYAMYGVKLPSYFGLVQAGFPFLLSYAVLFNLIPLVRSLWIRNENAKILERNKKRRMWRTALSAGLVKITRKVNAASRLGTKMKELKTSDVIFDTSAPLTENERKKQQTMLDDFDRMLGS